jgi:sugar phosphate isomerase/epimerase
VPFKRFGQALRELRYRGPAVLEVVSRDPDGDIDDSVSALSRLGW